MGNTPCKVEKNDLDNCMKHLEKDEKAPNCDNLMLKYEQCMEKSKLPNTVEEPDNNKNKEKK